MEVKDILLELRKKNNLTQDELAEKVFVTRQAVSRWESGETTPNVETLKILSKLYDVSINTLLGSPRKLICQCCGKPLEDSITSKEPDGLFNEEYCKWCYVDGKFVATSLEGLIDFLVGQMTKKNFPAEQARTYFEELLPKLNHWSKMRIVSMNTTDRDVLQLFSLHDDFMIEFLGDDRACYTRYSESENIETCWVAYSDNSPVGCIAFRKRSDSVGEVKRLFIKSEFRGRGISRKLLDAVERYAREHGCHTLFLDTRITLEPAVSIYRNFGFSVVFQQGLYIQMEKQLGGRT